VFTGAYKTLPRRNCRRIVKSISYDQNTPTTAEVGLGDAVCLQGNVPLSLLVGGTPDDMKDYCRKLIDVVGKGGGFIMAPSTALDDAKPENVKAMFDVTKEYGVYS
jgi:uroporphyrinogen-III decarboxylase